MRKTLSLLTAGLLLTSLAACSSGGSKGDGRECLDVSPEVMEAIAEGSNEFPITPVAAAAVKSVERSNVTIIALKFTEDADPEEAQEAVWAVGGDLADFPGIGPWLAVDAVADLYSDFPRQIGGEELDATEDGATEALDCLVAL